MAQIFSVIWQVYLNYLKYHPLPTKAITAASLNFASSYVTQKLILKVPQMDKMKALKFASFSFVLALISHNWYRWLDKQFPQKEEKDKNGKVKPPPPDLLRSIKMMLVDELVYDPFCIVFFYAYIGLLSGQSLDEVKQTIVKEYWPTQIASWKLWPAVQVLNFSIVPSHLRLLFMNCVSFAWNTFLQLKVSKSE